MTRESTDGASRPDATSLVNFPTGLRRHVNSGHPLKSVV